MVKLKLGVLGGRYWYLNSDCHRANGPAVVYATGSKSWHWYGKRVDEYEHMMLAQQQKETAND
jgi:hypothetical protein